MRPPNQHVSIDFRMILTIAGRTLKSRSFIAILFLGLLATGYWAYMSQPVYRSEAVLLYQDRGGSNPVAQQDMPSPRRIAAGLQEMLFSHALLEKLVSEFGLYPGTVARFGLVGAADEMQKHDLFFSAPREGYSFRIAFEATTPELAQMVTARASQLLIRAQLDASAQKSEETKSFLDGEKKRAEEELRKRESELAFFAAQHPEAIQVNAARTGTVFDEGSAPATASLGLEMQALQLRERLNQMHARPAGSSEPSKAGVPQDLAEVLSRAEAELAAAQHDLADKQSQFTEEYPGVKRAMVRVETAKARLRHLEEKAAIPLQVPASATQEPATSGAEPAEAQMVREQLALLEKQIRATRSRPRSAAARPEFSGDPAMQGRMRAEYVELEWRARESRERLSLLESRHFQAEMQSMLESQSKRGDLVVLDPAFRPAVPIRSPRLKILLAGVFASLLISLAIGLGLVLRDDRLYRASDVRRFGLPTVLAEVPPP
jgi:capsular polysaccharide biosynthesis protein/flagellar hook-basal body complex protein FliE